MSQAATRKDVDEVIGILRDFMQQVDERFTVMENRIDERFNRVESELGDLKLSQHQLLNTIDGIPLENL